MEAACGAQRRGVPGWPLRLFLDSSYWKGTLQVPRRASRLNGLATVLVASAALALGLPTDGLRPLKQRAQQCGLEEAWGQVGSPPETYSGSPGPPDRPMSREDGLQTKAKHRGWLWVLFTGGLVPELSPQRRGYKTTSALGSVQPATG